MLAPHRRVTLLGTGLATALLTTGALTAGSAHAVASRTLFHPYVSTDPTVNGADAANVAIGDVSGDGRPDIVMTTDYGSDPASSFSLWVYRQQGGGGLDAPVQIRTGAGYGSVMAVALADLDGDTDLDAAVTASGGVLLYEQGAGGLVHASTIPVTGGRDLAAGDLDSDGLADLAVNTSDGVVVVRQTPAGPDAYSVGQLSSLKAVEVEVGDVTGDGRADVVTGEYRSVKVYPQTADGFGSPVTYASGGPDPTWDRVNGIAVGDTNGDGLLDVHASVGGNSPSSWVVTRLQRGDGTLGTPQVRTSYDEPGALVVADVTGDGFQDLVVAHGGWNEVGVYDSTPGTAPTETLYGVPYASSYEPKGLAVGDISDDGRADVALADYNNGLVLLRGAPPGADITPPQTTITSSPPSTLRSRTATVGFTSDEDGILECALDSGAWTVCTSPWTYSDLSGGSHKIAVRATDRAGNVDASPAGAYFTVDGPDTSITSGPTGPIRASSATFSFASQPTAASYECALDGYDWSPCTSPETVTGLAPGSAHLFYVRGLSSDGLADLSPAHRVVEVDPQADLALTGTAAPAPVKKGGTLTWTTLVRNLGASAATGIRLTQGVPAGTTFVSASVGSATSLCSLTSGVVRCAVPDLSAASSATVTVRATVTAAKGTLSSTASVTSTSWDPLATNDVASTTVSIGPGK